jgi:hypothetical protein
MTPAKYGTEAVTQYYRNCKWKRDISVLNRSISHKCTRKHERYVFHHPYGEVCIDSIHPKLTQCDSLCYYLF